MPSVKVCMEAYERKPSVLGASFARHRATTAACWYRGFTVVEILCVCAIVAILGSLLTPVLARAVHSAHETGGLEKLKQLHLAFMLYRSDHDGDGKYGTATEMGLPDHSQLKSGGAHLVISSNKDLWEPACGAHPQIPLKPPLQYVYPVDNSAASAGYYRKYGDEAVLLLDENCTDHNVALNGAFELKTVIGVRMSGTAKKLLTRGYPDSVDNWH